MPSICRISLKSLISFKGSISSPLVWCVAEAARRPPLPPQPTRKYDVSTDVVGRVCVRPSVQPSKGGRKRKERTSERAEEERSALRPSDTYRPHLSRLLRMHRQSAHLGHSGVATARGRLPSMQFRACSLSCV